MTELSGGHRELTTDVRVNQESDELLGVVVRVQTALDSEVDSDKSCVSLRLLLKVWCPTTGHGDDGGEGGVQEVAPPPK